MVAASNESNKAFCLVATELCLFSLQDLSDVPQNLRREFLKQKASQLSPFRKTAHYVYSAGDHAQLWMWDKELEDELSGGLDVALMPEQLLLPVPKEPLCVRRGRERSQLEYWDKSILQAIKPLPRQAVETDQSEFLAGLSMNNDQQVWEELNFDYLEAPRNQPKLLSKEWFIQPKILTFVVSACCFLLLSGFLGQYLRWTYLLNTKGSDIDDQSQDAQMLLLKREEVLALERRNQVISGFFRYAPVVDLVAEFEESAGSFYDELLEWNFDQGTLNVLLLDSKGDSRLYIESLSLSELFTNVSASPDIRPDSIRIKMDVKPAISRQLSVIEEILNTKDDPENLEGI